MEMNRHIIVGFICLVFCAGAFARPANPFLILKQQPDGSVVSVFEHGDENYHYETTSDGYLVLKDEDGFRKFADENAEPSEFKAENVDARSVKATAFLKSKNLYKMLARHREKHPDAYPDQQKRLMEGFRLNHKVPAQESSVPVMYRPEPLTFTKGEVRFPVFLVSSNDGTDERTFSDAEVAAYNDQCNKEGYSEDSHYGSIRDYFKVSSNNIFRPTFDMVPVKVNVNMASAGSDEGSFVKAVVKAGAAAIGDANLNKYDADGDKVIDGFGIVMAGPEKNTGMWGHMYWYSVYDSYTKYNGYKFERYFLIAQLADEGANNGIGVMTHEFSHVLGLPDFYSSYEDEWVPGPSPYDVMTQGMYNGYSYSTGGQGRQPPKYSAFERESMGWMKIEELKESDDVYVLPNIDANKAYSITNPSNQDEFYVIEYRPGIGWDSKISGTDFDNKSAETGVYIWYVNYTSDAWDYFPNKGDARRYTLAATLVGSGSNSGTKQFSASNPPRRTMATFSSRYNVYNMLKSGNDRVCFSTKQSVGVNSCPELASSSSVAPVSSSVAPVSSSSASVVSSSSWAVASSSSTSVWRSSSSVQPVSSVAELSSSSSMVWWPISSSSSSMEGDSSTTAILEVSLNAACSLDLDGRVLNVRVPSAGAKTLRVFDLQGNELTRYGFDGAEGRFDLSGLGSGARVVRVTVGRVLLKVQRIVLK